MTADPAQADALAALRESEERYQLPGGAIHLESAPAGGTRTIVLLPVGGLSGTVPTVGPPTPSMPATTAFLVALLGGELTSRSH